MSEPEPLSPEQELREQGHRKTAWVIGFITGFLVGWQICMVVLR